LEAGICLNVSKVGDYGGGVPAPPPPAAVTAALNWRPDIRIGAVFLAAALISRLPTFFISVLDWDESLYFLVAAQWRAGNLPYTTIWDNKPIGIYAIFALFQAVLGERIAAIRIATVLCIAVTAFAVFRIVLLVPAVDARLRRRCAVFAGFAFIIASLSNDGLAANTEIFMACFTALAVLTGISPGLPGFRPGLRAFGAGLLFGCAFMTKYVAVFEAPAVAFALLAFAAPGARLKTAMLAAAGGALPMALTILLYAAAGQLPTWWNCSIAANFLRVAGPFDAGALQFALNLQAVRWLPFYLCAAAMLGLAVLRPGRLPVLLVLWLAGGCLGVAAAKSFFDHYFLQILPVLCVSTAWVLLRLGGPVAGLPRPALGACFALILLIPCFAAGSAMLNACRPVLSGDHFRPVWHPDTPARIAAALAALPPGQADRIYVFDYQPIIYGLAHAMPPTRFAFPSTLTKCFLAHVAGVDGAAEVARIFRQEPQFVIRSRLPFTDPVVFNRAVFAETDQAIAAGYVLWRVYPDAQVYRRRPGAASFVAANLPAGCQR
jgi:hypothetical protein